MTSHPDTRATVDRFARLVVETARRDPVGAFYLFCFGVVAGAMVMAEVTSKRAKCRPSELPEG